LRLIHRGRYNEHSVESDPAFESELGVSSADYARLCSVQLGKRLLDNKVLNLAEIAQATGHGSARRLSTAIRNEYQCTPTQIRTRAVKVVGDQDLVSLHYAVREPYDAAWVFEFLERRALPGLEEVRGGVYWRRLPGPQDLWLRVSYVAGEVQLQLPRQAFEQNQQQPLLGLPDLIARTHQVFDLGAEPAVVGSHLGKDERLGPLVRARPGIRVPGAWDGFETAVRAILGQQVSVARARNLAIDLMRRFGSSGDFPAPAELVDADVSAVGMPGKRGAAVRELAGAVLSGALVLDETSESSVLFEALCSLPGIGPWTAGYICMRVAGDPDAFPRGDWVILKRLGATAAQAERLAQDWRPWRAYALMYIWSSQ
jgi:AraC family transcriptional regulator of adaptative response / DNA-3-methyladenine glycosylase II